MSLHKIISSLILVAMILFISCNKEEDQNYIAGFIQKGPFVQGSEVTVMELDEGMNQSGSIFITQTNDDFGSFSLREPISGSFISVITTGYYFNEVTGHLSNAPIKLRAITSDGNSTINVNILTTLSESRIKYLIGETGLSFESARNQAENEVLLVFKIDKEQLGLNDLLHFEQMDMAEDGYSNAILIAISAVLQQGNTEAQLTELVNKITDDIKTDGELNNSTYANELYQNAIDLDLDSVRYYLTSRYNQLGLNVSVPEFELFVDSDGDGVVNLKEVSEPVISPEPLMIHPGPVTISVSTSTENATIFYTLDGSDPTTGSTIYTEPFVIGLAGETTTVKAFAVKEGLSPSSVASQTYFFMFQQTFSVKYSLMAGTYNQDIQLELYSETADAEIYYTTDGSVPSAQSIKYESPLLISGDGTVLEIKAIALHQHLDASLISGSYYKIDYEFDPDTYIIDLTVQAYKNHMTGHWIGHVITPWVGPYNVEITFEDGGHYSARALSGYKYPFGSETWQSAFYYGTDADSDLKKIDVYDLYANGKAYGEIVIVFGEGSTNVDDLKHISLGNDFDYLRFEMYHHGQYGPLQYFLTRVPE